MTPAPTDAADRSTITATGWELVTPDGGATRLNGTPITIGSGPKCVLRLPRPEAKPLHCVVSLGADAPVARGWAEGVLLNGAPIESAALSIGDRLSIAGYEVTLAGVGVADPSPDVTKVEPTPRPPTDRQPSDTDSAAGAPEGWASIEPCDEVPSESPTDEQTDLTAVTVEKSPSGSASHAVLTADDPAVPSHLLRPWTTDESPDTAEATFESSESVLGAEPSRVDPAPALTQDAAEDAPVSGESDNRDTAEAQNHLTASDVPAAEDDATDRADEWAAALTGDDSSRSAALPAGDIDAADAWQAECAAEPTLAESSPSSLAPEEASEQEADVAAELEQLPNPATPTAKKDTDRQADGGALRARIVAGRERVRLLVSALREERVVSLAWHDEATKQTELLAAAEEGLRHAEERIDDLLAKNAEAETRAEDADAGRRAAFERASKSQLHVEALEAQLAALAAAAESLADAQLVPDAQQVTEVEPCAERAPSPSVEDESNDSFVAHEGDLVDPPAAVSEQGEPEWEPQEPAAELSPWGAQPQEVEDAGRTIEGPTAEATETDITTPVVSEHELAQQERAADEPAYEDPWEIERLADDPASAAAPAAEAALDASTEGAPVEGAPSAELADAADIAAHSRPQPLDDNAADATEPTAEVWEQAEDHEVDAPVGERDGQDPLAPDGAVGESIGAETDGDQEPVHEAFDPFAPAKPDPDADPFKPVSFIDQFAENLPSESESVEAPQPIGSVMAFDDPPASGDEDESIDDYMKKLLGRMRGEESPPAPIAEESAPAEAVDLTPVAAAVAVEVVPEPAAPIRDIADLPRSAVPEGNTDLGALRQLANQSARHAIDVAATKSNRERATTGLALSAIGVVSGALAAITAQQVLGVQFIGGLGAVVVCGAIGVRTLRGCQTPAVELGNPSASDDAEPAGIEPTGERSELEAPSQIDAV